MLRPSPVEGRPAAPITPLLLGFVSGAGVQLFQPLLWPWQAYAGFCGVGLAGVLAAGAGRGTVRILLAFAMALLLGFGQTGWRGAAFQHTELEIGRAHV